MDYLIISIASAAAAALTLFSGFGLGTLLMPVFAIFFPVELAVALTAIVHFLNNVLKLALLGRFAEKSILIQFGISAILGAFLGASVLVWLSGLEPFLQYSLGHLDLEVMPVKVTVAVLLVLFAVFELLPRFEQMSFKKKYRGLSKEQFLGTGVVIACAVDVSRISVYYPYFSLDKMEDQAWLLAVAIASAFLGTFLGNRLVKKVTMRSIQMLVSVMLLGIAIGLAGGLL
jgi:uncharacterized membrane protein YfcA